MRYLKKILSVILCTIILGGCANEEYEYNVNANKYSSFIALSLNDEFDNSKSYLCKEINLSYLDNISSNAVIMDYCLYKDFIAAIYSVNGKQKIYTINENSATEICEYDIDESIFINDMNCAGNKIFWLESGSTHGNIIKCLDTETFEIKSLTDDNDGEYFIRIYSDGDCLYCSDYNSEINQWNILKYNGKEFVDFKENIYVQNQYNPFFIGNDNIQYLTTDNNNVILNIENLKSNAKTSVNLNAEAKKLGINTISCNSSYIAWRDIKSVTDYSSVSTILYDTASDNIYNIRVTDSKLRISSLTSGIINNKIFVHFSRDFNGYSNIYLYDIESKKTTNLTQNTDNEVSYSFPKIIGNKLTFTSQKEDNATNAYILEL